MIFMADGVLGLMRLRIEPRPRWSEQRWHQIVQQDGRVVTLPWEPPVPGRYNAQHANVIGPSGRTLVLPVRQDQDPFSQEPFTLAFTDVARTRVVDLGFSADGSGRGSWSLDCAVSPDDQAVAVTSRGSKRESTSSTLHVLRGPQLQPAAHRELNYRFVRHNDVNLQWSPDGRYLAATYRDENFLRGFQPGQMPNSLQVIDARTLDPVLIMHGTRLLGSLSWSPDGDRLSVVHDFRPHVLHLGTQRLDPLPWLPDRIEDPPRAAVVLGLLSDNRALVMRQTKRRVRISSVDLASGESRELASLPITDYDWPAVLNLTRQWETLV